jgi:hypothetical protein
MKLDLRKKSADDLPAGARAAQLAHNVGPEPEHTDGRPGGARTAQLAHGVVPPALEV